MEKEEKQFRSACRFYEAEFPGEEEIVICQVIKTDDKIGAYVSLLEYDRKEGIITVGEISKRRIRSMAKELRVGSNEVCLVVHVDAEKGYINLSKKRVAPEDCAPKQEAFANAKAVHGIMQHVAEVNDIPIEELCNKVSWPLNLNKKHTSAYHAFKKHINKEINVWDEVDFSKPGMDLTDKADKLKKDVEQILERRLTPAQVRLQAKCEVACSEYEGIEAVREALTEGFKASKPECKVDIKLIAHPMFALSCMTKDKELGVGTLDEAMQLIANAIKAKGGTFEIKSKPAYVTKDEKDKHEEEDDDDNKSSGSSSDGDQDETMGNFNADFSDLMKKELEGGADEGDD